ncbi:hypothetical protein, conserved, partial [Eimeria acervulina]
MPIATESVELPIPLVAPVADNCSTRQRFACSSSQRKPTESSAFEGEWRISGKPFLDKQLLIPPLSHVLQQMPKQQQQQQQQHRIRVVPDMQQFPLLQAQAEKFLADIH